jgi:hypothetical protein
MNSPVGFERYPTAPSVTGVGDQSGNVTRKHGQNIKLLYLSYIREG